MVLGCSEDCDGEFRTDGWTTTIVCPWSNQKASCHQMHQQLPRIYATEEKTWEQSGFFLFMWNQHLPTEYSRGKVSSIPLFQTPNLFPFLQNPHSCTFPLIFLCYKRGLNNLKRRKQYNAIGGENQVWTSNHRSGNRNSTLPPWHKREVVWP